MDQDKRFPKTPRKGILQPRKGSMSMMLIICRRRRHVHHGGAGSGYEQSSPEICDTGKGFFDARHTRDGSQPYFKGIRTRPRGARRQPRRNILYLRRVAADWHGRGTPAAGRLSTPKSMPRTTTATRLCTWRRIMAAEVAELLLANHAAVPAPVAAVEETLRRLVSRAAPALQDRAAR